MSIHATMSCVLITLALQLTRVYAGCAITPVNGHVDIPDGTTSIGHSAFYGCTSLETLSIPDSVKSIS